MQYCKPPCLIPLFQLLLCFQCLENILLYTASDESHSSTGMGPSPGTQLTRSILSEHMRPLYSSLVTTCPMKLVAACLRLLTAMVMQGRHTAREVQQSFNFGYKPLTLFPAKTHRVQVVLCVVVVSVVWSCMFVVASCCRLCSFSCTLSICVPHSCRVFCVCGSLIVSPTVSHLHVHVSLVAYCPFVCLPSSLFSLCLSTRGVYTCICVPAFCIAYVHVQCSMYMLNCCVACFVSLRAILSR